MTHDYTAHLEQFDPETALTVEKSVISATGVSPVAAIASLRKKARQLGLVIDQDCHDIWVSSFTAWAATPSERCPPPTSPAPRGVWG